MRLQDYDTRRRFTAVVKSNTRLTSPEGSEDVRELHLSLDEVQVPVAPGQTVGVLVPGPHAFGQDYHFRLYSVADTPEAGETTEITLCVRRCTYIDEYSGEAFKGVASHYLCDAQPGKQILLSGPYGLPFEIPKDNTAPILMIGLGTGIAPFRAFVKKIYQQHGGWEGKVRLFFGAHTGLDMIYMNDERDDFALYYDKATFEAFKAVSPRPHWQEPAAIDEALLQHQHEVWSMINEPNTHVYIAGLNMIRDMLDKAFIEMAGSKETWQRRKAELVAGERWTELTFD